MAAVLPRHVRHHRGRLGIAASVALGVHTLAILALVPVLRRSAPRDQDDARGAAQTPAAVAEMLPEISPTPEQQQQIQVIEVIPPDVEQPPPPDTPRIAEHDVNPARETHKAGRVPAPGHGRTGGEARVAAPTPLPTEPPPMPPQAVVAQDRDQDEDPEAPAVIVGPERTEPPKTAEAAAPRPGPAPPPRPRRAEAGDPLPTVGVGGGTDDYLPDIPAGADTAVRARRSAMAAFLNQVRVQVTDRWRPLSVFRRDTPNVTRIDVTSLRVRVRADGALAATDLQSGSGMVALDAEAMRALEEAQPFQKPPPEILDAAGGFSFNFNFHVDLPLALFLTNVRRLVMEHWKPSTAFRKFGTGDRVTIVRALLTGEGVLAHVAVVTSSGMDLLDEGVLAAFKPRMRFPAPPAALGEVAGIIPVRIGFLHSIRGENEVRVLRDTRRDNPK